LGLNNFWESPFISIVGKLGVVLFFVLSGFLITYLLLKEEKKTGTIQVKKFYIRRILRIWPLYYLLFALAFFLFPYIPYLQSTNNFSSLFSNYKSNILLFIFFMPNVAYIKNAAIPFVSQAWSVGVEEQFYFQWPLLMKSIKKKQNLLLGVIAVYLLIKFSLFAIWKTNPLEHSGIKTFLRFWEIFNIDCMAIGGLAALFYFRNNRKILDFVYKRSTQYVVTIAVLILLICGVRIPYFHFEFYAVLFAIIILNLATNPNPIYTLESKGLNYLGKISYGMYMFHPVLIYIVLKFLTGIGITNFLIQLFTETLLTVIISSLSYELLEKHFLKKKLKYSTLISGDNAETQDGGRKIEN
jgi:peptidoglycan/LPS O-acetylase OafA/YrhL